jgi:prepilin-type N-terminal cleavage/methylation domain-containing protein
MQKSSPGFSILELLVVILILGILTTLTLIWLMQARSSFELSNAVGTLQSYLEYAISDAKRRNARGDKRAKIRVLSAKTYQIMMDSNGDGALDATNITLPGESQFLYDAGDPPKATIDWRGNIAEGNVTFVVKSSGGGVSEVRLTSMGDASTDSTLPVLPVVTVTPISDDVKPSAALVGNATPNPDYSPTPDPTPLPICVGEQLPDPDQCRCPAGKKIDDKGKCK